MVIIKRLYTFMLQRFLPLFMMTFFYLLVHRIDAIFVAFNR